MKKILVIEDDYNVRAMIRELLVSNMYEVYCASDGKEGLNLAKQVSPDLVLCDIMLPQMDGYQVLSNMRSETESQSTPFIYLSALTEISDIRKGMEYGADDYIPKPFRASNVLKAIETRMKRFDTIQSKETSKIDTINSHGLTEQSRLFIPGKNQTHVIKVSEIYCIKADGEYSFVYTSEIKKYLVRKLIKDWENQLPECFVRIHRSTIINVDYVEKIEKWSNRSYMLFLKNNPERFIVSQRYSQKIKTRLFLK